MPAKMQVQASRPDCGADLLAMLEQEARGNCTLEESGELESVLRY
jgi:hypothetical protein